MAVFRVEKNKGYTVMSNHHLRNKELFLKAKGLLSQMLSLPEDWDYTLAGLSLINRESIDAISTAVWELEKAGYIARRQGRDEKGKMTAIEYTVYEQPQPPERKRQTHTEYMRKLSRTISSMSISSSTLTLKKNAWTRLCHLSLKRSAPNERLSVSPGTITRQSL